MGHAAGLCVNIDSFEGNGCDTCEYYFLNWNFDTDREKPKKSNIQSYQQVAYYTVTAICGSENSTKDTDIQLRLVIRIRLDDC